MTKEGAEEKIVPIGVVLITIGLIVVLLAAAVLFIRPVSQQAAAVRTPLPVVTVVVTPIPSPTNESTSATAEEINTEIILPANLVSVNDAPRSSLDNQPQRIVIPSLAVDAPVVDVNLAFVESNGDTYYQWQVPAAYEAGWHNSSAPLGQVGNTVLNGHHNIFGEVFGKLVDLEVGAEIMVYDKNIPHTYTVADVQILPERGQPLAVRVENAAWIQPTNDERLTLVTCWPHTDNSHRLIVVAYPTDSSSN